MSWISGFSPDFQDAYERRFKYKVESLPIFNDWVKEWNRWTNPNVGIGITQFEPISKSQLKALAYEAKIEGIQNISIETSVRDKRTKTGFRMVYKDITTGRFAKNPYREDLE